MLNAINKAWIKLVIWPGGPQPKKGKPMGSLRRGSIGVRTSNGSPSGDLSSNVELSFKNIGCPKCRKDRETLVGEPKISR